MNIDVDSFPMPPKEGYKTEPSWSALKKLSIKELKAVNNFKIYNKYGSIEFFGATDITELNFAHLVTINQKSVEVYPIDTEHNKPPIGQKLNKPALITLFGGNKPKKDQKPEQVEALLIDSLNKLNA